MWPHACHLSPKLRFACLFESNYVCLPNPVDFLLYSPQGPLPSPRVYHQSLLSWLIENSEDLLLHLITSLHSIVALNLLGLLNEW